MMKMHEVVIEMAFVVLKNVKSFEILLKVYPTKRENAVENLNHISFFVWAVTNNTKIRVLVMSLLCKKIEQLKFCFPRLKISHSKLRYFEKFGKKWQK